MGFAIATGTGRGSSSSTTALTALLLRRPVAAGTAQITTLLIDFIAPILSVRLLLFDQIEREDVGAVDSEEAEEGDIHSP